MGTSGKYIEGIHACNSCGAYLFECDDCGMLNDVSRNIYEPCMCPTNASFFCKCDASHARSSASAPHFKTRDGEDIPLKNISLTGPSILELFGRSRVDKTSALFGSSDQRATIPSDIPYKEDDGRNLGDSTYLSALGDSKRTGKNILLTLNRRENDELLHGKEAELKKNQSNIAVSIPFVDSVTQRQKEVFSSMRDEVKTKAREEKVGLEEKVLELGKKIEADEMVRKSLENDIRILKHSLKYIQATKNNQTEMLDKLSRKLVQVSQQKKDLSTENSKLKSQILDNMERYSFDESESGDDSDGSIDPESFRNGLEALKEGHFISETDATNITNILLRADTEDEENIVRRLIWKLLKGQGSDEGKHDFLSSIDPLERSKIKEADFQRKLEELFNSGNLKEDEMDALMEVIDECTYGEQRDAMLSILNSVIKHYDETIQFSDNVSICYPEISGDTTRPERKDIIELIVKSLKEFFGSAFSSDQIVSGVEQMKTLLTEISAENLQTSNLIDLVTQKLEEIKDLQDKCDTKDLTSTFTEMVELVDGVKEFQFDSENKDPVWMRLLTSGDQLLNEKLTTYESLVNTLNEILKCPVTTENVAQLKSQLDNLKTDFIEDIKTIAGYKKNIATIASKLNSVESLELFEQVKTIETSLSEFKTNLESAQTPVQELPEENEVTEVTPEIPPPPPSRAIPNPPALQRNLLSSRVSTLKAPNGEMKLIEPELYDFLLKIAGLPKEEGSGDIPHVNKSLDESSLMIPNLHEC